MLLFVLLLLLSELPQQLLIHVLCCHVVVNAVAYRALQLPGYDDCCCHVLLVVAGSCCVAFDFVLC